MFQAFRSVGKKPALPPVANLLGRSVVQQTGTYRSQPFIHALPDARPGAGTHTAGLPNNVVLALRGPASDAARCCYRAALKSAGTAFDTPLHRRTAAAANTANPDAVFDVFHELSESNRADEQRRCGDWKTEFKQAAGPGAAHRLQQVGRVADAVRQQPLELTHFSPPVAVHTQDGVSVVHLLSDAEKRRRGASDPGSESIDVETLNLEEAVYCSIQTPGDHGKRKSRFGPERYACLVDDAAAQLSRCSVLLHDFAYLPTEDHEPLFHGKSGSTGCDALDRQMLESLKLGAPPAALSDHQLGEIAVSVRRLDEATHDIDTTARASDLYRHARDCSELRECLAEAVEARLASLLTRCTTRLAQLEAMGLAQSPAHIAIDAVLRRLHEVLDRADASAVNVCLNHLGLRPQVLVPSSLVMPAGSPATGHAATHIRA